MGDSIPDLVCTACDRRAEITRPIPWCDCGGLFELGFRPSELVIDEALGSMWRYGSMLPVGEPVSIAESISPISEIRLGERTVAAKHDYLFPTGSFKDRGAAVFVSVLKEAGIDRFIEDSSGNAGAAMAVYAARARIACEIYCPASASGPKLAQIERAGAEIHRIPGPRANATEALGSRVGEVFYASHNWHPLFLQGTKTLAFEIAEQYNWKPPGHIVAPAGGGSVIMGLQRGFEELKMLGRIETLPDLYAIQAAACAPLVDAEVKPRPSLAEGILSPKPPRLEELRRSIRQAASVSEPEIEAGFDALCRQGVAVEPTTAVLWAGLGKLEIPAGEPVLVILTGVGIKFQRPR